MAKTKNKRKLKPKSKHTVFHEVKEKPKPTKQKLLSIGYTEDAVKMMPIEKAQPLKPRPRPKRTARPCELSPTEIKLSFAIILSVSLLALFFGIFPNIYGLAFCVITLSLLVFTIMGKLLKLDKQFL